MKIHTIEEDVDAFKQEYLPDQENLFKKLAKYFTDESLSERDHWNLIRKETLNIFIQNFLSKELTRQAQNYLREISGNNISLISNIRGIYNR